ncbi:MAG TPA: hypothetical protein VKP67_01305 [Xanthobacteraceae bacterium]|nr:hypothetical protein [Xanthobacteraceae bacterium]
MHKLTIVAATIAFGAMLGSAQAEILGGAPNKNGNQCFKYSSGNERDGRFGSWGACPQAASTPATQQQQRARRPASR